MEEAKPMPDCGAIIEKYLRWMYMVAYRQVNARKEDVEEAIANAYLAFLEDCNSGEYQHRDRGIGEYLKNAVNMKYRDLMRKRYRHEPSLDAKEWDADLLVFANQLFYPDPLTSLLDEELSNRLDDCLSRLPPKQREAFLCVYAHESSYQEAATTLAIEVNTVRTRLYMARQKLRVCLEKKGYRHE